MPPNVENETQNIKNRTTKPLKLRVEALSALRKSST
jgi:hypothetical protein